MKKIIYFFKKSGSKIAKIAVNIAWISAAVLILVMILSGFDYSRLQVTFYNLSSNKVNGQVRVAMLSDLHLREFGMDNADLVDRVKSLQPDLIAVAGDLTIYGESDHKVAVSLLNQLSDVAPVYYSFGNHEYAEILFNKDSTLRKDLDNTKATLVNNSSETVQINNANIEIGGICVSPSDFSDVHKKFLTEYCKKDSFKLLLCHHVECFDSVMKDYPVDLALTGHAHGGQIVLPIIGPLYSPDQGFMPELTDGLHTLCDSSVVISRGLGNSNNLPRYNNDPEIVVVDISSY